MNSTCPICCEVLGTASATTECGHAFCTRCLLDAVAKNVGSEEGSTRNLCPLCRSNICDEVEPSKNLTIRLSDLEARCESAEDTVEYLNEDLEAAASMSAAVAETFRDNFSRMETLMTTKDERIATLGLKLDTVRSDVMIDAARQRRILDLILPAHERVFSSDDGDDDSDMDTAEDDWESASEAESARPSPPLPPPLLLLSLSLSLLAIWIEGEWFQRLTGSTAQDFLVSLVI